MATRFRFVWERSMMIRAFARNFIPSSKTVLLGTLLLTIFRSTLRGASDSGAVSRLPRARARAWNGAAGGDDAVAAFASEWTFRTRRLSTAPICHRRGQTVDDGQEAYAHEPATAARVSRLRVILNPVR